MWATDLHSQSAPTYSTAPQPAGSNTLMWGTDLTNTMTPEIERGELTVVTGLSFKRE